MPTGWPMTSSAEPGTWAWVDTRVRAAVTGVAGTDPTAWDPFRGLYVTDQIALDLAERRPGGGVDERLKLAGERLGLDPLESSMLALCAAPELDARYGRLFAYLQDDATRKLASPRLMASLLGSDVRTGDVFACFDRTRTLRRSAAVRLVEFGGPTPLAERGVLIAERLAAFLLGADLDEADGSGQLMRVDRVGPVLGREATVKEVRQHVARGSRLPLLVCGHDAPEVLAEALGRGLLLADVATADDTELMAEATITAALEGRACAFRIVETLERAESDRGLDALAAAPEPLLLCARSADAVTALGDRTTIVIAVPAPVLEERRSAWRALSGAEEFDDVAAKFQLSVAQIAGACEVARLAAANDGRAQPSAADLDGGARQASSSQLGELAVRLEARFGWDDLVLPERARAVLRSLPGYLRHRDLVLREWEFGRSVAGGQGLKALFAGESGTGKTMAAQVIARDLGLELFRIDLATIVSKYIGETEKNLDRVFDAAEGSNAILFFDEADALFGKRSAVRDSHDRYANMEVGYLLQKMESYAGAVMLATNIRNNVDSAFLRRLDFVIDFPLPDAADRERIWRQILPDAAPLAKDVDLAFLAERFKLSGGSIRNAAVAAAFQAAADGGTIGMPQLVQAVALEYGKLGRLTLETDFERFHELVRS
jgi:hypothetical protein